MFISALSEAANESRGPVILLPRDAKLSPGLMIFMSSTMPGPYVGGWMDKSRYVDYELKLEPGKYRLAVKLVPQGGGYLSAKIDEGQAIRRQVVRSRQPIYTPIEIKYGEVDIPNAGARLRFTGDNINQPGLALFFQAELTWVGPSTATSRVKSPLEQAAEKERAAKEALVAKSGDALADRLKGTIEAAAKQQESMAAARSGGGDMAAMRESMQKMNTERNDALKAGLTDEQKKKFDENVAAMPQGRRGGF